MFGPQQAPLDLYHEDRWYACWTRARAEKKVGQALQARNIPAYVPLIEKRQQWADRVKTVAFPLFPSYVFGRFRLMQLEQVLRTPGVASIVRVNGYPTPIPERDIESVHALVNGVNETGVEPHPSDYLTVGEPVVVIDGPFKGMHGTLLEDKGKSKVIVRLPAIRHAVGVEMNRRYLRVA